MTRVVVVSPEPTPYRAPLFDRLAARTDVDLTVVYAARSVAGRVWQVQIHHQARFLRGIRLPGAARVVHHDYPVTPGIFSALRACRPDVVVISGWSTFASQAALVWCRIHRTPYVLLVESHDRGSRTGWRRAVKDAVVPRLVRRASGVLTVGSLSRESMLARGARPDRIGTFANTIDVGSFAQRAAELADRRSDLRAEFGIEAGDVAVACVARLSPEKGLETLVRAAAAADPLVTLLVVGGGAERQSLEQLARDLGVRARFAGDLPWERIIETYVASDIFALLSLRETWGVVVNEAAACGLPLVLSDQVGAAPDLLRDGENGFLVAAGNTVAAAGALSAIAGNSDLRRQFGERSRQIVESWGYEPSVASFVDVVSAAAADRI